MEEKDFNLINPENVEAYLKKFCGSDDRLQMLLIAAAATVMKRNPWLNFPVTELPENASAELKALWPTKNEWHVFDPDRRTKYPREYGLVTATYKLPFQIGLLVDWLTLAMKEDADWLKETDEQGRPRKLLNIRTWKELFAVETEDMKLLKEKIIPEPKSEPPPDTPEDITTIMTFHDGLRFVKLNTLAALERQSAYMDPLLDSADYRKSLTEKKRFFYSLRDTDNLPLVTLIVNPKYYLIHRLADKSGNPPIDYIMHVASFCDEFLLPLAPAMRFHEKDYKIDSLEEFSCYEGLDFKARPSYEVKNIKFKEPGVKVILPELVRADFFYIQDMSNLKKFPDMMIVNKDASFMGGPFPPAPPRILIVHGKIYTTLDTFDTVEDFLAKHYPS